MSMTTTLLVRLAYSDQLSLDAVVASLQEKAQIKTVTLSIFLLLEQRALVGLNLKL